MLLIETQLSVNNYQLFLFIFLVFGLFPNVQRPSLSPLLRLFSRLRAQPVLMSFNLWQIYLCINLKFALSRFRFSLSHSLSRLLSGSDYRLAQGTAAPCSLSPLSPKSENLKCSLSPRVCVRR